MAILARSSAVKAVPNSAVMFVRLENAKLSTYVYNGGSNLRDSCRVGLFRRMSDERTRDAMSHLPHTPCMM